MSGEFPTPRQPEPERGEPPLTPRQRVEKFLGRARHGSTKVKALYDMGMNNELAAKTDDMAAKERAKGPHAPMNWQFVQLLSADQAVDDRIHWRKHFGRGASAYREANAEAQEIYWAYQAVAETDPFVE